MRIPTRRGVGCLAVHAVAALVIGVACFGLDAYHETKAAQMLKRVGGEGQMAHWLGSSVIIEATFAGASPTAEDLAALVPLRALRTVDLSFSRIGDRELAALVPCRAQLIIVPDGCTSRRVRQQFAEGRLVIGYGLSFRQNPAKNDCTKPYAEEDDRVDQKSIAGDLRRSPQCRSTRGTVRTSCSADNSSSGHSFAARASRPEKHRLQHAGKSSRPESTRGDHSPSFHCKTLAWGSFCRSRSTPASVT